MTKTPDVVSAEQIAGPNATKQEVERVLTALEHNLTVDTAAGVAAVSSQEKAESQQQLADMFLGKKRKGFLDPFDFSNWDFTKNIADALANPEPPKLRPGQQVEKFDSRAQQFVETEKTRPISSAAPADVRKAIIDAADSHGIDPNALLALSYNESRWKTNAYNASTGAAGLFQFIPSTARAMGGFDVFDPVQNANHAADLWNISKAGLAHDLNRDPEKISAGEVMFAHQQGIGGAVALLNHRDMSAVDALMTTKAYKDKRWLAERAVTLNGGEVGMSAGAFADKWINHYNKIYGQIQVAELNRAGPDANHFDTGNSHGSRPPYRSMGGGPSADESLASKVEGIFKKVVDKAKGIGSPETPSTG